MIVGASLGGVLVTAFGPGWGLAVDAPNFAIAAASRCYGVVLAGKQLRQASLTPVRGLGPSTSATVTTVLRRVRPKSGVGRSDLPDLHDHFQPFN